jgi:hypothetical protein
VAINITRCANFIERRAHGIVIDITHVVNMTVRSDTTNHQWINSAKEQNVFPVNKMRGGDG